MTLIDIYKDVIDILSSDLKIRNRKEFTLKYEVSEEDRTTIHKDMLNMCDSGGCPYPELHDHKGGKKGFYKFQVLDVKVELH